MTNLEITSFAKTLCKGLKQYLKNENIKMNDIDFQELESILINEFNLPFSEQAQTPTQLLNNFIKTIYKFEKVITPQDLGIEAHKQIMIWGLLKADNFNG
jgi:hypothetical protein